MSSSTIQSTTQLLEILSSHWLYPHPHAYNCSLITPAPCCARSQLTIHTGSLSIQNVRRCEAIKDLSRPVKASGCKRVWGTQCYHDGIHAIAREKDYMERWIALCNWSCTDIYSVWEIKYITTKRFPEVLLTDHPRKPSTYNTLAQTCHCWCTHLILDFNIYNSNISSFLAVYPRLKFYIMLVHLQYNPIG